MWSALLKSHADRLSGLTAMSACYGAVGALSLVWLPPIAPPVIPVVVVSAALHVIYMLFMAWSYRLGDLSQVYPLARGTSPLLIAVAGYVGLRERPGATHATGVLLVALGLVAAASGSFRGADRRAVGVAILTGLSITSYSVVDGLGVRHAGSVAAYAAWLQASMGVGFVLVMLGWRGRRALQLSRHTWRHGALNSFLSGTGYVLVLFAQTRAELSTVAALRETSVVFAAVLGAWVMRERLGARRIVASAVVVAGVALLA